MCGIALLVAGLSKEDPRRRKDFNELLDQIKENLWRRGPDCNWWDVIQKGEHYLLFANSLLQLQGYEDRSPYLRDADTGSILLWNGEVYSGLHHTVEENDGVVLFQTLISCRNSEDIVSTFSRIRGPWSVIYYDGVTNVVWFGRDFMGRKSLLFQQSENHGLVITSTASKRDSEAEFIEVPPGLYSLDVDTLLQWCHEPGWFPEKIPWADQTITRLSEYHRTKSYFSGKVNDKNDLIDALLAILKNAVHQRCARLVHNSDQNMMTSVHEPSKFMILFSGGVDSTLLAAMMHATVPQEEPIELFSVCFAQGGSPDRIGAMDAYKELKTIYPDREWRLIAVDKTYDELNTLRDHLLDILYPSDTVMDFNIGGGLWLASQGKGSWVECSTLDPNVSDFEVIDSNYVSSARVVFLGHGADELFGGYGRHRTKFREAGWDGLSDELRLDVRRLWQRNFGRDDRIISDHGKESRIPFVDEHVIEFALDAHLQDLVDLNLPIGVGDKIILRRCLNRLGLERTSKRHKRALQFGSRLAKAANAACFGSTQMANKRKAGEKKIEPILRNQNNL
ncbi:hypothetical protein M9435_000149 [Picochlorum sp. BPE23]|nr:hypothetical protein M9435_000149 [Picochlorum sp. BPE23]